MFIYICIIIFLSMLRGQYDYTQQKREPINLYNLKYVNMYGCQKKK